MQAEANGGVAPAKSVGQLVKGAADGGGYWLVGSGRLKINGQGLEWRQSTS